MNNKKSQGIIGTWIVLIVVGLVWAVGLAPVFSTIGPAMVVANSLTGCNAFFYSNLNLLFGFFYLLAWVVVVRLG